jgi:hypothetical protein
VPHLVAHEKRRHAQREHGYRKEVLHLAICAKPGCGIASRTLDAHVPASVVIGAIPVARSLEGKAIQNYVAGVRAMNAFAIFGAYGRRA